MGCHSHGPISGAMLRLTGELDRNAIDDAIRALDLKSCPFYDRDNDRQALIDHFARLAGER